MLVAILAPMFFYKLGQSSLVSWDEAWYADIARTMVKTGDILNLKWSGKAYLDHPPMGFWLEALAFKLFGVSEFSARMMSAVAGVLSLVFIYLLGKELFEPAVGLAAMPALASGYWFLYRARSGNLDIFLTLFFILSIYLGVKSTKSSKYLPIFAFSLGMLFLTKTAVPLVIIPALAVGFWKKQFHLKQTMLALVIFGLLISSWFVVQYIQHADFLARSLNIGLPDVSLKTNYWQNLGQAKRFLHEGIGKWFWPGVLAVFAGFLTGQRRFLILSIFCLSFFVPFIFSNRGGIWHLIPLYPFLILEFFGLMYVVMRKFRVRPLLMSAIILGVSFYTSFIQLRRSFYEFVEIPAYISDEATLAMEAAKYPYPLYIEGSDFRPAAAFYSEKDVPNRLYVAELETFSKSLGKKLIITYQTELEIAGVSTENYLILKSDRDKILILTGN